MKRFKPEIRAAISFLSIRIFAFLTLLTVARIKGVSFGHIFQRWDAQWYRRIAEGGYGQVIIAPDGRHLADYAFFPLFPLSERYLHQISGLSFIASGIAINIAASIIAALAIYKVIKEFAPERVALITVAVWAALPIANVINLAYSESIFTAFAAWSLYFSLKKSWIFAAMLASCAGLTRPTGLAVALSVIVAAGFELKANSRNMRALAAIAIAPVGWIIYIAWVGIKLGKWNGYFTVTDGWGNSIDGGYSFAKWIVKFFTEGDFLSGGLVLVALTGLTFLALKLWKLKIPIPLMVYSTVIILLAFSTSGYFGSKPRYLLPVFPLLLPISFWLRRKSREIQVLTFSIFGVLSAVFGALWLTGSGPL